MTTTEVCLACGAGIDGRTHDCDCDAHLEADLEALIADRECPLCGGEPTLLGVLGRLTHCRCRDCGIDFSFRTEA